MGRFNQSQIRGLLKGYKYEIRKDIGGEMGGRLSRDISILSFLLVGTRCINSSVWFNFFQRYVTFCPNIFMGLSIFGFWVRHIR